MRIPLLINERMSNFVLIILGIIFIVIYAQTTSIHLDLISIGAFSIVVGIVSEYRRSLLMKPFKIGLLIFYFLTTALAAYSIISVQELTSNEIFLALIFISLSIVALMFILISLFSK